MYILYKRALTQVTFTATQEGAEAWPGQFAVATPGGEFITSRRV